MSSPSETEPNLESTRYDCALCRQPNHADNMVCCEKCEKWFHFMCAKVTAEIENHPWICKVCSKKGTGDKSSQREGTIVDVSDLSAKDPVDSTNPNSAKKSSENEQTPDSEQEEADLQHQEELRQMRVKFERQLQRDKEKMALQLRLEREMLQIKKAAEAQFNKLRSDLYKEFECRMEPPDEEVGAVGGEKVPNSRPNQLQADTDLDDAWREKFNFPSQEKNQFLIIAELFQNALRPKKQRLNCIPAITSDRFSRRFRREQHRVRIPKCQQRRLIYRLCRCTLTRCSIRRPPPSQT